jgi:hypothetical protein
MAQQNTDLLSPNFQQQSNLPNATTSLVLGIISIVASFCYGIFGLILGIIGLILANKDRKLYEQAPELYSSASFGQSNAGRICSIIGIIISGLIVLFFLFFIILFGSLSYESLRHFN